MDSGNDIEILVKSSSGDPYTVKFNLDENDLSAFCSCPAGIYRKLCKHILSIISNDESILYDRNQIEHIEQINTHLQKTIIPSLLSELKDSEELLEKAQKEVKKAGQNIEKAILHK
mgnify:CR=1 FL=1